MTCGPGKLGDWLVPDCIFGMNMFEVCRWHDEAYTNPGGRTKGQIDRVFLERLLILAGWSWRKRLVARTYYYAVTRGRLSWIWCRLKDKWK